MPRNALQVLIGTAGLAGKRSPKDRADAFLKDTYAGKAASAAHGCLGMMHLFAAASLTILQCHRSISDSEYIVCRNTVLLLCRTYFVVGSRLLEQAMISETEHSMQGSDMLLDYYYSILIPF